MPLQHKSFYLLLQSGITGGLAAYYMPTDRENVLFDTVQSKTRQHL
jgi:hypothetical protein